MIALDAMGGDFAPDVTVQGAISAAKKGISVKLFGDEIQLRALLTKADRNWQSLPLFLVHCSQIVSMADEPSRAVLKKKESSLVKATQAVADGAADAVVSAGNSGAMLVAGTLILGRVDGVMRPALGNFLPTRSGASLFCMDLGANTDCKPEYLEQFAFMGHTYVRLAKGIKNPRIALLSNGAEAYKGSSVVKQAYALLDNHTHLNFVGNLESRYVFDDHADVLVCDGFAGNIMLKAIQGTAQTLMFWLKQESARSLAHKLFFALGAGIFKRLKRRTDYASQGGALLLGVSKPCIVAHGSSSAVAIEHAIIFADSIVRKNSIPLFNQALSECIAVSEKSKASVMHTFGHISAVREQEQ